MDKKEEKKYKDAIGSMLNNIMSPEQAKDVFNNMFNPKIIKGYKKGDFYKFNEITKLKVGDIIYFKFWDDDDRVRTSGEFGKIDTIEFTKFGEFEFITGGWSFFIRKNDLDSNKIINHYIESSGWSFSVYKTIPE
jgi:hypothetical protein